MEITPGPYLSFLLYVFVILAYRHHKDMMPGKHYILHFFGGLICGFVLESDATSLLNITIKVDVNEKTVIDQSYQTGKLIRFNTFLFCKYYFYC